MPTADATVFVSATGFALSKGTTRSGRVALRLERDPGVRLRVRDPTGAPAPGAVVRTASARDRITNAGTSTARRTISTPAALGGFDTPLAITDENGETVIGRTPGAETALEVEAADGAFAQLSLPAAIPAASQERQYILGVRLEDPLRIPGRIVDVASGLPIHGAGIWVELFPGQHAFSDSTGAFDLTSRPGNRATRLEATATGFLPERIDISAADLSSREEVRIGLTPSASIRGLVTDEAGQPVGGASVRANGYPLLVRAGVRTNAGEPVLIELKPGASVGGRVLDNGGNGVAGILVSLRIERNYRTGGDPRLWGAQDMFPRQMTDAEGRFRFDRLVPGTRSAETKKGTEGAKLDQIELAPGAEREIELLLQTRDRLTVIVTTDGGEPVTGARITIQSPGERLPSGYGQTDGSGQSITDIAPGPATVEVSHERLQNASRQVDLDPGDNELRFELQPGLEISGTVRSYDGTRLALATVEAQTEHSFDTDFHRTNTVSDQNGTFRLIGLEPLRYNLTARSPGYADGGPDEPINLGGGSVDGIEVVLEPGASIVGIVTGLSPADLAQVEVQVRRNPRSRSTKPEADGRFSVDSIAPGTWRVIARKGDPPSWRTVERSVTLEPGATEAYVELPYERGLRIAGQVLDAGEPLVGGSVRAHPVGGGQGQTATSDNLGRFELEGLEPGTHQLTIGRPLGGGMEYHSIDLQTDLEGLRFDLEPATATLTGGVVDAQTGQPIDFARVTAADAATIGTLARAGDTAPLVTGASASFSLTEGRFELKLRANAEQLWVIRSGYEGRQIPISVASGEHREGLVIELQPVPSTPPNP